MALLILLVSLGANAQETINISDPKALKGSWSCNLDYLDYSAGKTYKIKAGAKVSLRKE